MITIKKFVFNPFQVNTYVVFDETKECAIIDPGCSTRVEHSSLVDFIENEGLRPVHILNTHSHIDHVAGNAFVADTYNLEVSAHNDGTVFIDRFEETGHIYGFEIDKVVYPQIPLHEGTDIRFGESALEVLETPGHAIGSVCFVNREQKFVIVGDVLFYQSIGRTDLPTGNYNALIENIFEKLFTLGDDYMVYCGHGPETSIGFERMSNPFLTQL